MLEPTSIKAAERGYKSNSRGLRLEHLGTALIRYSTVFLLVFWGAAKWTEAEAKGIEPLMRHSPLMSWMFRSMNAQSASEVIGIIELLAALLILLRHWRPGISAVGSALTGVMALCTLSFLVTTPDLDPVMSGFLLKDIFLFGGSVLVAGEALAAYDTERPIGPRPARQVTTRHESDSPKEQSSDS